MKLQLNNIHVYKMFWNRNHLPALLILTYLSIHLYWLNSPLNFNNSM